MKNDQPSQKMAPISSRRFSPVIDAHGSNVSRLRMHIVSNRKAWLSGVGVGLLIVIAFFLRLHELGAKTYHLDEAITVLLTDPDKPFLESVYRGTIKNINDVPGEQVFHYLIRHVKDDEWGHRFPAVIFGSLSVLFIYVWVCRVWGRTAGIAAAILLTFSAYHIGISRDASRPTYMVYLFTFALGWSHHLAATRLRWKYWLLFGLVGAIGLMFHVFVIIPLAACAACACIDVILRRRDRKAVQRYIFSFAFSVLLALTPFLLWFMLAGIRSDPKIYNPMEINVEFLWTVVAPATGSTPSELGTQSTRAILILILSGIGVLSMALKRERRRELGWLSVLLVLMLYFHEMTKGTKYFAVRHSAFFHPLILFSAAGGIVAIASWLQKLFTFLLRSIKIRRGLQLSIVSILLIYLTATNVSVISKYYVDGLHAQYLPFRYIVEFVAENIKPDEVVAIKGHMFRWFFHVYAPHLKFVPVEGSIFNVPSTQKGYWYIGSLEDFKKPGFTQVRFKVPVWAIGYARRENEFADSVSKFKSSGVAGIDDPLLKLVPDKLAFLKSAIAKARSFSDRRQRAMSLSMYSEYLRSNHRHTHKQIIWELAEEAVRADPYSRYLRYFSAESSLLVGKYDLAVQRAKESIGMQFYFPPLLTLHAASIRSDGQALNDECLLKEIDAILAIDDSQIKKNERKIKRLRSKVERRMRRK